jgi:type I restriction enzyme, S subunit
MDADREIPNGWEITNLQGAVYVLDNLRKPINSDEREKRISSKKESELYPYYGATGQVGWIDEYITDGEYVLVGEDGAPFLDLFKPKAYIIKGKTWVNNHAHILRFREGVTTNAFILHFLNQFNYDGYVNGTTRLKLTKSSLKEIPFPLPPLSEQHRIVAKIEELFSSLDKGIESLKTAQQQLKVYRQAVLKWAFEGKLTNRNVVDGELPDGWKRARLKELVERISDGPFGSNLKTSDYVDNGVRVIRLENIGCMEFRNEFQSFVTERKYETIKKHTVSKGDIILSSFVSENIRAVILPDFIDKAINKADCFLVRACEDKILNKYLCFYFSTREMYQQLIGEIHGATRPRINTTQLKLCQIPLASLPEQNRIVSEIESRLSVCDKIEDSIEQSLKQAGSLRQSILKKAFVGRLVPQDPNDEPASVLLARIKAERERNKSENPPLRQTRKARMKKAAA